MLPKQKEIRSKHVSMCVQPPRTVTGVSDNPRDPHTVMLERCEMNEWMPWLLIPCLHVRILEETIRAGQDALDTLRQITRCLGFA